MQPIEILKPTDLHFAPLLPLIMLMALFVGNFVLEILRPRTGRSVAGAWTVLVAVVGAVYLIFCPVQPNATAVHQMWVNDGLTRIGALIVYLALGLSALVVPRYLRDSGHLGEYFALLSAAALGMVMLMGSNSLMMVFLSLELFSLALYLLCIFLPDRHAMQESGLKYFILSSLASAVLLYGIALVYGATGSTWLSEIANQVNQGGLLLMLGSALIAAGLAFKVSAVPFHLWTPDVYQGAPTPVTAFMSVATKAAALVALLRFFPLCLGTATGAGDTQRVGWWIIIWSLAVLSMLFGNLMALSQTNLKRLLAYSGIAQAGYLLGTVFVGTSGAQASLGYYLLVYLCMNVGAFVVCAALEEVGEDLSLSSLAGLSQRQPFLSAALAVFMFSLTGLPPTAGFFAKYSLFTMMLTAGGGLLPKYLVAAGLLGSLLSAGYYLRVVAQAYSPGLAPEPQQSPPPAFIVVIGICVFGVVALAVACQPTLNWIGQQLGV